MDMHQAFESAVAAVKTQGAFARGVNTSQQRISYLLKHRRPMPAELVLPAEALTGMPRHILRPDIYPAPAPADDAASDTNQPDLFPDAAAADAIHGGVVPASAPIVACDRSAILHPEVPRG